MRHSDREGKCVLLTGANGFTGIHVSRLLESAGFNVVSAVQKEIADADEILLDVTSLASCRHVAQTVKPDYVIHLAAISFVQHPDPLDFYRVNVLGTLNLLQGLADAQIVLRKMIIASSANIYGNTEAVTIRETDIPQPLNHYAASKVSMEYLVSTWFDRFPIILTRPFNYTGVGQGSNFLIPKIVQHFALGESVIELGNIDVERDFSDIRYVAEIYKRLLVCDYSGEVVNICGGKAYSLRDMLSMMATVAGYEITVKTNPEFVRKNEIHRLTGSVDKLCQMIGPIEPPPMMETLQIMFDELKH